MAMRRPEIVKRGALWRCEGAEVAAYGKTPSSAYSNWFNAIGKEIRLLAAGVDHTTRKLIEARHLYERGTEKIKKQVSETAPGEGIPDAWIVRRIQHYNQACIDHIWATGTLPTYEQYVEWTGRSR